MRIILEGCDGVGKTTLAKILANKYNLDICHCTIDDPSDYDFYYHSIRKNNVIWDRHTIGELIYPKVFERKQNISSEDARIIISKAKDLNIKMFVLTTNLDIIRNRLNSRGNEHSKILNNINWINQRFLFYANEFCIPIIDTSKMTLNDIFNLMEE